VHQSNQGACSSATATAQQNTMLGPAVEMIQLDQGSVHEGTNGCNFKQDVWLLCIVHIMQQF